jgi:hypothetical protein
MTMRTDHDQRLIRWHTSVRCDRGIGLGTNGERRSNQNSPGLMLAFALVVAAICLNSVFPELMIVIQDWFAR